MKECVENRSATSVTEYTFIMNEQPTTCVV